MIRRSLFLLLACLSVIACIDVDDFGAYWDKGTADPLLEGTWFNEKNKECLSLILDKKNQYLLSAHEGSVMRTLTVGNHTFLMDKRPQKKNGSLVKYTLTKDVLKLYALNEAKKDEFIKNHASSNIVFSDSTVTIRILDENTLALLQKIADTPDYWKSNNTSYRRREESCAPSEATH